jgi:hypothetical protein
MMKMNNEIDMSKPIVMSAVVDIKAEVAKDGEEKKLPTFTMKAYDGDKMTVDYWGDVVVDISGMVKADKTPVLLSHQSYSLDSVLGMTSTVSGDNEIKATGQIMANNEISSQVLTLAKNGFVFQASIGVEVKRYKDIDAGESVEVNGRTIDGPFTLIQASRLREISIVPLGADSDTETAIAAEKKTGHNTNQQERQMTTEKIKETPTAEQIRADAVTEQKRILTVQAAAKEYPDISAKAVEQGWDESKTKSEVQAAKAVEQAAHIAKLEAKIKADEETAKRPQSPKIKGERAPVKDARVIEAAVALRAGLKTAEKRYDADTLNAAEDLHIHSITDLVKASCAMTGTRLEASRHETREFLQAAFSTRSIANILSNLANKFILEGYGVVEQAWRSVANIRPVVDFKANTGSRLVLTNLLKELGPGGEIEHGELSDEARTVQADTKAIMLGVSRKDIINDDLGALTDLPRRLGFAAARTFNVDFWAAFEAAVAANFETDGTKKNQQLGTLSLATLKTAEKLFLELTDADGNPLGTEATTLLVSPANSAVAREIFASTNLVGGSAKDVATNIYAGMFQPVVSRYISANPWYLVANPLAMPLMEAAFLNGRQEPFVETADADFNTLGVQMRCYFDYGASFGEWRSAVRSTGASS